MQFIIGLVILAFSTVAASEELGRFDPLGKNWKPEKKEGYVERDIISVISEIALSVDYHFDKQCYSSISERVFLRNKNIPAFDHLRDISLQLPKALSLEMDMAKSLITIDAGDSMYQFDCNGKH